MALVSSVGAIMNKGTVSIFVRLEKCFMYLCVWPACTVNSVIGAGGMAQGLDHH